MKVQLGVCHLCPHTCPVKLSEQPLCLIPRPVRLAIVQELCESRGGRPELSVLTSLVVFVDVKNY